MLNDMLSGGGAAAAANGEPSLGSQYRELNARLARTIQKSHILRTRQAAHVLEQAQIKLDAWADLVGVRKEVLEQVDIENGALAASTRQGFYLLLEAMDHVETKLQLRDRPGDGSLPRPDALTHVEMLFETQLMAKLSAFHGYAQGRPTAVARRKQSSHSPGVRSIQNVNGTQHYPRHPVPAAQPAEPPRLRKDSHFSGYYHTSSNRHSPSIKTELDGYEGIVDVNSELQSRPSTAQSFYTPPVVQPMYSQRSYPSITQLLSSPVQQTTAIPQQTPSMSSGSTPATPWTPYQTVASPPPTFSPDYFDRTTTPQTEHEKWTNIVLSPLQLMEGTMTPRGTRVLHYLAPIEPPMAPFFGSPQIQPVFNIEGRLASDSPRSNSQNGWLSTISSASTTPPAVSQ